MVAGQIAGAGLANVRAYEPEQHRAEALAELDRAKTAFFSNVSHEFRTPLTLMLGPLVDAVASGGTISRRASVAEGSRWRTATACWLLQLVNTLLDFSRLEAGRIQGGV